MATSTTNLGLTKPSVNDAADIGVLNSNFDKIDAKIPAAGAAPSGYGLGVPSLNTEFINTTAKLDALGVNRWYIFTGGAADPIVVSGATITYAWGRVDTYNDNNLIMTLHAYAPSELKNRMCELVRYKVEGVWSQWEWVNPPMQLGVEYRTTERHNSKAVYVQAVSFGALPNAKEKLVSYSSKYGTVGGVLCVYGYTSGGIALPYNSSYANYRLYASTTAVGIETDADKSSQTAIVIVKYCLA